MMFYFYIPEGICFAAFIALSCTWLHYARFHLCFSVVFFRLFSDSCVHVCLLAYLQEYESETSYTPEDGHVGRNM
jgi:hypothetical protein